MGNFSGGWNAGIYCHWKNYLSKLPISHLYVNEMKSGMAIITPLLQLFYAGEVGNFFLCTRGSFRIHCLKLKNVAKFKLFGMNFQLLRE